MLVQCLLGFPLRAEHNGAVRSLLLIDTASQAAWLDLGGGKDRKQNLEHSGVLLWRRHNSESRDDHVPYIIAGTVPNWFQTQDMSFNTLMRKY